MAYGTPADLDGVEAYYTHIRGGRPPSPEALAELTARYRAIGGSPLLEITRAQAGGIERRLGIKTYLGLKHSAPFIADAVAAMESDDVERAAGLVLAPHFSKMSIGDYRRRAEKAADEIGWGARIDVTECWHLEPGYIDWLVGAVKTALGSLNGVAAPVVFSAHSLPERIRAEGDPYPDQLRETAAAVASRAGIEDWDVAWQSAAATGQPWMGPDILEVIEDLAERGAEAVVLCPCGFVADHLEVLYDIDIQAAGLAARLSIGFARTAMPNDDPGFLDTLAGVAKRALA
jgi:protoporphyrin/coproporphyrin ferrochelatase